jgi:hypothetical protein
MRAGFVATKTPSTDQRGPGTKVLPSNHSPRVHAMDWAQEAAGAASNASAKIARIIFLSILMAEFASRPL